METFINGNINLALLGVIIGGLLSFFATWILQKKETTLRVTERILDHRIEAHETFGKFATTLGITDQIGYYENDPAKVIDAPWFMESEEQFKKMMNDNQNLYKSYRFWLSTEVGNYLGLLGVYFTELHRVLSHTSTDNYWAIGLIINDDIAEFSIGLRNLCTRHLFTNVLQLKVPEPHTLLDQQIVTERRRQLNNTALFSQRKKIDTITNSDPQQLRAQQKFIWVDTQT